MLRRILLGVALLLVLGGAGAWLVLRHFEQANQRASLDPAYFEDAIRAFEAADRASPPAPGAIVLVGSSSIRLWDTLERDLAPLRTLERGFGGAHMAHVLHNAERIVIACRPSAVVVYAGDNDLADGTGKTAEDVARDFRALLAKLRTAIPELPVYFVTIKPSRLRWDRWPEMERANRLIAALAERDPRLAVLDVATPMLSGRAGPPDASLFRLDGLHLSDEGYALWTSVIRPRLLADLPPAG